MVTALLAQIKYNKDASVDDASKWEIAGIREIDKEDFKFIPDFYQLGPENDEGNGCTTWRVSTHFYGLLKPRTKESQIKKSSNSNQSQVESKYKEIWSLFEKEDDYSICDEEYDQWYVDVVFRADSGEKIREVLEKEQKPMDEYQPDKLKYYVFKRSNAETAESHVTAVGTRQIDIESTDGKKRKANLETKPSLAVGDKNYEAMLQDLQSIYEGSIFSPDSDEEMGRDSSLLEKIKEYKEKLKKVLYRIDECPEEEIGSAYECVSARKIKKITSRTLVQLSMQKTKVDARVNISGYDIYEHRMMRTFFMWMESLIERQIEDLSNDMIRLEIEYIERIEKWEEEAINCIKKRAEVNGENFGKSKKNFLMYRNLQDYGKKIETISEEIKEFRKNIINVQEEIFDNNIENKEKPKYDIRNFADSLDKYENYYQVNAKRWKDEKEVPIKRDLEHKRNMVKWGLNKDFDSKKKNTNGYSEYYIPFTEHKECYAKYNKWLDIKEKKEEWKKQKREIRELVSEFSFLSGISIKREERLHESALFLNQPDYRRVYTIIKEAKKGILSGISLFSNENKLRVINSERLFEYWCFIKILDIFVNTYHFEIINNRKKGVDSIKSCLQDYFEKGGHLSGEEKIVHLKRVLKHRGDEGKDKKYNLIIELHYQGELNGYRPDLYADIKFNDGDTRRFIFDAKYRDYGTKDRPVQTKKQWLDDLYNVAELKYLLVANNKKKMADPEIVGSYIIHSDANTNRTIYPDVSSDSIIQPSYVPIWPENSCSEWKETLDEKGFPSEGDMQIQYAEYLGMWRSIKDEKTYTPYPYPKFLSEGKTFKKLYIDSLSKDQASLRKKLKSKDPEKWTEEECEDALNDVRGKELMSKNGSNLGENLRIGTIGILPNNISRLKLLITMIMEFHMKVSRKCETHYDGYDLICWECGGENINKFYSGYNYNDKFITKSIIYDCHDCGAEWKRINCYPYTNGHYFNRRWHNYLPVKSGAIANTFCPYCGKSYYNDRADYKFYRDEEEDYELILHDKIKKEGMTISNEVEEEKRHHLPKKTDDKKIISTTSEKSVKEKNDVDKITQPVMSKTDYEDIKREKNEKFDRLNSAFYKDFETFESAISDIKDKEHNVLMEYFNGDWENCWKPSSKITAKNIKEYFSVIDFYLEDGRFTGPRKNYSHSGLNIFLNHSVSLGYKCFSEVMDLQWKGVSHVTKEKMIQAYFMDEEDGWIPYGIEPDRIVNLLSDKIKLPRENYTDYYSYIKKCDTKLRNYCIGFGARTFISIVKSIKDIDDDIVEWFFRLFWEDEWEKYKKKYLEESWNLENENKKDEIYDDYFNLVFKYISEEELNLNNSLKYYKSYVYSGMMEADVKNLFSEKNFDEINELVENYGSGIAIYFNTIWLKDKNIKITKIDLLKYCKLFKCIDQSRNMDKPLKKLLEIAEQLGCTEKKINSIRKYIR